MSSSVAVQRLKTERKNWKRDHPLGFVAKPTTQEDGSVNMLVWTCLVPGKEGTDWAGAYYPVTITFDENYPAKPPRVALPAHFFHPNIYPSGKVCLSILNEAQGWKPSITVKQILVGVQELLECANERDPANGEANELYVTNRQEYRRRVRLQAKQYPHTIG